MYWNYLLNVKGKKKQILNWIGEEKKEIWKNKSLQHIIHHSILRYRIYCFCNPGNKKDINFRAIKVERSREEKGQKLILVRKNTARFAIYSDT